MKFFPLLLLLILVLSACSEFFPDSKDKDEKDKSRPNFDIAAHELRVEFEESIKGARQCTASEQCTVVSPGCPLGCATYVHQDYVLAVLKRADELIERFENEVFGGCNYGCVTSQEPVCVEGLCSGDTPTHVTIKEVRFSPVDSESTADDYIVRADSQGNAVPEIIALNSLGAMALEFAREVPSPNRVTLLSSLTLYFANENGSHLYGIIFTYLAFSETQGVFISNPVSFRNFIFTRNGANRSLDVTEQKLFRFAQNSLVINIAAILDIAKQYGVVVDEKVLNYTFEYHYGYENSGKIKGKILFLPTTNTEKSMP